MLTQADLETQNRPRILVSGASGMIGTALLNHWMRKSVQLFQLVREPSSANSTAPGIESIHWNPLEPVPFAAADLMRLNGIDAAIHLSGAGVASGRWTPKYKREIVSSRVRTTQALAAALTRLTPPPRVLVCASAIGIYGDRGEETLTEASEPGSGFLAETCVAWEAASRAAEDAGIRVVHVRFGVVLARQGGALARLLPLFRLGLGGNLGNGREWMPWLTLSDATGILRYCVENDTLRGPVNAVAPQPATNATFTKALGAALRRPTLVPAPAFALRLAFGEMANEALLASAKVVPAKLVKAGYQFADPQIEAALQGLLR